MKKYLVLLILGFLFIFLSIFISDNSNLRIKISDFYQNNFIEYSIDPENFLFRVVKIDEEKYELYISEKDRSESIVSFYIGQNLNQSLSFFNGWRYENFTGGSVLTPPENCSKLIIRLFFRPDLPVKFSNEIIGKFSENNISLFSGLSCQND